MKKFYIFLLPLALTIGGCSIYHPQTVDIPLINHAGDTRVDAAVGISTWLLPDVVTFGGTVSYGITDWLAAQAHANYGFENAYGQLALGAYRRLGSHGVVEGYLGFGLGVFADQADVASSDTTGNGTYAYSGHFTLPFGQLNIGWHDLGRAHIDLAFGL